jgi:DNA-binding transcriptional LysR family regulator
MITSRVEYFLAAWRERSFSRAALRCGVSQPSLTNGIQSLEEDLGGRLFQRYPHFGLTDLGQRVLPLMKRMERAAKEARLLQRRSAHLLRTQERDGKDRDLRIS